MAKIQHGFAAKIKTGLAPKTSMIYGL